MKRFNFRLWLIIGLTWWLVAILVGGVYAASYRTANFIVDAPTAELAQEIATRAELARQELAVSWLGQAMPNWSQPCPISVQCGPSMGAGGATSFVFDRGEVFGWDMRVQGSRQRLLDSVIPHEVTHTIFASHFRRPLPRWADEGACTTVEHESERRMQDAVLIGSLRGGKGIGFGKLFAMTDYPPDVGPLYAQSHSLARFLVLDGGRRRFVEFLGAGLQAQDWPGAMRKFYGYQNLTTLQAEWLAWVKDGSPPLVAWDAHQAAAAKPIEPPAISSSPTSSPTTVTAYQYMGPFGQADCSTGNCETTGQQYGQPYYPSAFPQATQPTLRPAAPKTYGPRRLQPLNAQQQQQPQSTAPSTATAPPLVPLTPLAQQSQQAPQAQAATSNESDDRWRPVIERAIERGVGAASDKLAERVDRSISSLGDGLQSKLDQREQDLRAGVAQKFNELPGKVSEGLAPKISELGTSISERLSERLSGLGGAVSGGAGASATVNILGTAVSTGLRNALIAAGIPTGAASLLIWFLHRRVMKRLRGGGLVGGGSVGVSGAASGVAVIDSAPLPQVFRTHNQFVPYENDRFAQAHAWAQEQLARKYPGSIDAIETLNALIQQKLAADAAAGQRR